MALTLWKFRTAFAMSVAVISTICGANAETLIVGNKVEDTVSFIDLNTGKEVARRPTGRAPHEIAVSPDGATAVVVSYAAQGYQGRTLHLFDVGTAEPLGEISLGEHRAPHGLKWVPGTDQVIVTTEATNNVALVDIGERKLVASIATDQVGTHMVALSPDAKTAYTGNIGSGSFTVLDPETGEKIRDVKAGDGTEAITVSPDGDRVIVGNNNSKNVMVFDAQTFEKLATYDVPGVPIRVEHSPVDDIIAVSMPIINKVHFYAADDFALLGEVNTADAGATVPVTMLFSDDGSTLWIAATGSAKVLEIDVGRFDVQRIFDAGAGSDGLGYSSLDARPQD